MTPTPPKAASRRPAQDGRPSLTLVTDQEQPATPTASEKQGPKHAGPRRLPPVGDVTVRALMVLGALVTALGLSMGKADAILSTHKPAEEADPSDDDEYTPTAPPVVATSHTTPSTASSAAHWTPTTRPAAVATYAVQITAPTGKHRGSASVEGWGEWNPDQWDRPTGRHRGSPWARHGHNKPLVARQPVASTPHAKAVQVSVKVPALPPVIAALKRI